MPHDASDPTPLCSRLDVSRLLGFEHIAEAQAWRDSSEFLQSVAALHNKVGDETGGGVG